MIERRKDDGGGGEEGREGLMRGERIIEGEGRREEREC